MEVTAESSPAASGSKKSLLFALKLLISVGGLFLIYRHVLRRDGATDLWERLSTLHWGWIVAAIAMQLIAIGFSTVRWQRLLVGQGIHAPWRFLGGSILIARFWGAFTPGGFTGFGGWRIYDVAARTGKTARATATIGVEMVLGQLAFGVVVMLGSIFGMRFIGTKGVLLVNLAFLSIIAVGIAFLARPKMFLFFTRWLPAGIVTRIQTLIDAVLAYQGKGGLLVQAALLGVGTHAFNNLIYVCAARALGVELGVGEVFFASSLQILATLVPASINGIGLREAAAVALYTSPVVGLPLAVAVLIPTVGFACEMFVSAFGGLVFLLRRKGYEADIVVDDPDREQQAHAKIERAPRERWPSVIEGTVRGIGAGWLAGVVVGVCEAAAIGAASGGGIGWRPFVYGAVAYGLFCAFLGAGLGGVMALSGRMMARAAWSPRDALAGLCGTIVSLFFFALGAFRVRRDVFHEELVWKSGKGLLVLVGCLLAAMLVGALVAWIVRALSARAPGRVLLTSAGAVAVPLVATAIGVIALYAGAGAGSGAGSGSGAGAGTDSGSGAGSGSGTDSGNVLFVVVDTLRADHLPAYGYKSGHTPHLDAFAQDAVRFDQAFVNSSWTRPSFASFLTGRLPASHGVMSKSAALPDDLVTLPETLNEAGYATAGFVTNFNVAPYFNFDQGFDHYVYLEPDYVLGADDASAKLLLMQFLRQRIEKQRARAGHVEPGTAYQDAPTVNQHVSRWLDGAPSSAWFLFVGYMDPHDPYFPHPYDGSGYSRAANQHPRPDEAPKLRQLYNGEITFWDAHFGALVADLKKRGLYDDLTIVITSDHGEEFYEHGGYWHGTTLYDEQVRVPLYVKLPKSRRGGTSVFHWVQGIDIMPTLLKLQGIDAPAGVQGGDLFVGTDVVYAEESHEGNQLESVRMMKGTDEYKLITANPGNPRGLKDRELYRVDDDPAEQHDLTEKQPNDVALADKTLKAQRMLAKEGASVAKAVELQDDVAERLKAIGYIQDDDD